MRAARVFGAQVAVVVLVWAAALSEAAPAGPSLKENNDALFGEIQRVHGLSEAQMTSIRHIFQESGLAGQGNPAVTRHPATPEQ